MLSADWASESVWVSVGGLWVPVGVLALSSPAGYVFLCGFLPGVVLVELSCCLLHLHRGGGVRPLFKVLLGPACTPQYKDMQGPQYLQGPDVVATNSCCLCGCASWLHASSAGVLG